MNKSIFLALALCASPCFAQDVPKGLSLEEAIRIARRNNPTLGASRSDRDAAIANARIARAGTLPKISANGFATTGNNANIVGSSGSVEPSAWTLAPTGNFVDGNVSLMTPILAPSVQAMAGSASWQARASEGDLAEADADLALQVTDAYYRVQLGRQMVLAEQAKESSARELVRTTTALLEAGKGIEASVQRSQATLAQAQRALTTARNEEAKALIDLSAALGDDSVTVTPTDPLVIVSAPGRLEDDLANARRARGVLQAARARLESASADVRASEGKRLPNLYGTLMGDASNRREMGGVTAGLMVSFPIFDGGRIKAEVSQAQAMKAKAEAQLRQAEIVVAKEVRQARLDVETARVNAESAATSVQAAQSAYDVTTLRFNVGKAILVEQLDALEALVRAKSDLAQATYDEVLAVARLNRAAGRKS